MFGIALFLNNFHVVTEYDAHIRDWERFQRDPAAFDAEDFIRY